MKYLVGNWKMNQNLNDIENFFTEVIFHDQDHMEAWIAPQNIHVDLCARLGEVKNINVGTQNISWQDHGAFTGENSAAAAIELGATFTLVGHSEQRTYFNETNERLNKKTKNALKNKMKVIFCIGENLAQRENGETLSILKTQTLKGLEDIHDFSNVLIAYEPVWAIGTGKVATTKEIDEAHKFLKELCLKYFKTDVPILYGGSVKPDNIKEIMKIKNVDGALVGGASLKASDYNQLYNAMK